MTWPHPYRNEYDIIQHHSCTVLYNIRLAFSIASSCKIVVWSYHDVTRFLHDTLFSPLESAIMPTGCKDKKFNTKEIEIVESIHWNKMSPSSQGVQESA